MGYDIVGDDGMIVGWEADDLLSGYDILGAYRKPTRPGYGGRGYGASHGPGRPAGYGAAGPRHGTEIKTQSPRKDGQLALPVSASAVTAPSGSTTITGRPQVKAFRPERYVVANSIATFFSISDIKVGNTSQFVQAGTVPAEAFIQGAFGVEMRMDTVQTAQDFVVIANNLDATTSHTYLSVCFGRSVD